ncbi:uncharacterized protein LOC131384054 [Hylobates moloch]|uniref:uncharacterized protein LOC131384054 n=1 Tax=Hylobates moloch TaxID=81572 RepID=UPI002675FE59|nr:uncharacterized protein LOC131384054 [Hylobates moloch]
MNPGAAPGRAAHGEAEREARRRWKRERAGFCRVQCGSPGAEGAWHGGRSEEGGARRDIYREEAREVLGGGAVRVSREGAGRGESRRGNRGAWDMSAEGSGVQKWGLPRSGSDTQTTRRGAQARARRCSGSGVICAERGSADRARGSGRADAGGTRISIRPQSPREGRRVLKDQPPAREGVVTERGLGSGHFRVLCSKGTRGVRPGQKSGRRWWQTEPGRDCACARQLATVRPRMTARAWEIRQSVPSAWERRGPWAPTSSASNLQATLGSPDRVSLCLCH